MYNQFKFSKRGTTHTFKRSVGGPHHGLPIRASFCLGKASTVEAAEPPNQTLLLAKIVAENEKIFCQQPQGKSPVAENIHQAKDHTLHSAPEVHHTQMSERTKISPIYYTSGKKDSQLGHPPCVARNPFDFPLPADVATRYFSVPTHHTNPARASNTGEVKGEENLSPRIRACDGAQDSRGRRRRNEEGASVQCADGAQDKRGRGRVEESGRVEPGGGRGAGDTLGAIPAAPIPQGPARRERRFHSPHSRGPAQEMQLPRYLTND